MTVQKKILDLTGTQYLVQNIKGIVSDINTAISSKANDSDVVHKTGDETIAGVKSFSV